MNPTTFVFRGRIAQFRNQADTAEAWDGKWANAEISQQLMRARTGYLGVYRKGFLKHLPKDGVILEAGCGTGRYVMALMQNGYQMIGLDWAQNTLRRAKQYWPEAPYILGEITHLPLPSASLAAVISLGVIEHFLNPWILIDDLKRVLQASGILYLVVPCENRIRKFNKFRGKYPARNDPQDFYQFLFNRNEIEKEMISRGLSIIDCFATSGYAGLVDEWRNIDKIVQRIPFSHYLINFLNRCILMGSFSGHIIHVICRKSVNE